jgi:monoamine oxidase
MNHMMGCNSRWPDSEPESKFRMLQAPHGRHYMIGDQISHHSGWQEGAYASAHLALADLNRRVQAELSGRTAVG